MGIVGACCAEVEVDPPPSLSSFPPSSVNLVPICPTFVFYIPLPGCTPPGGASSYESVWLNHTVQWVENGATDAVCDLNVQIPSVFQGRNPPVNLLSLFSSYLCRFTVSGDDVVGERIRNDKQLKIYFKRKLYGPALDQSTLGPLIGPAWSVGWRQYRRRSYPERLYISDGINTIDLYWRLDPAAPGVCPILRMYRAEGSFDVSSNCQIYDWQIATFGRLWPEIKEEDCPTAVRYTITQVATNMSARLVATNAGCKQPADPLQCDWLTSYAGIQAVWTCPRTLMQVRDGMVTQATYSKIGVPDNPTGWVAGIGEARYNFNPLLGLANLVGFSAERGGSAGATRQNSITPRPCTGASDLHFVGQWRFNRKGTTERGPAGVGATFTVPPPSFAQQTPTVPPSTCGAAIVSSPGWLCNQAGLLASQPTPLPNEIANCNWMFPETFSGLCWATSLMPEFPYPTYRTVEYTPDCRWYGTTAIDNFGGSPNNQPYGIVHLVEPL